MKCPQIGALRDRVRLEEAQRTAGDGGTASIAWTPVVTVYAAIEPLKGGESVVADGLSASVTHRIMIRHRANVGPHLRFVQGQRVFNIRSVIDIEGRGLWLACLCEEQLP